MNEQPVRRRGRRQPAAARAARTARTAATASTATGRAARSRPAPTSPRATGWTSCSRPARRPDTTPPTVTGRLPAPRRRRRARRGANVSVSFSEPMSRGERRPEHVPAARPVRRTSCRPPSLRRRRRARPRSTRRAPLADATRYTATVKGGSAGVKDRAGNPLAADVTLVVHDRRRARAGPGRGPGRPDPRDRQGVEPVHALLRRDPARRGPERLHGARHRERHPGEPRRLRRGDPRRHRAHRRAGHDAQRLGDRRRRPRRHAAGQAARGPARAHRRRRDALERVHAGRRDAAARHRHRLPDRCSSTGRPTATASTAPRASPTCTRPRRPRRPRPPSRLRTVGTNGGRAAAFTYDLARSVVYTRQGNPAWAGQERDGQAPIRSDDLFFGAASSDPQPNWVDLSKVAIPQADEQQRLLANLLGLMTADKKPMPRFWYLPRGVKAAVIMTGDDHAQRRHRRALQPVPGGQPGRAARSRSGSASAARSYVYPNAPLTDAQACELHRAGLRGRPAREHRLRGLHAGVARGRLHRAS